MKIALPSVGRNLEDPVNTTFGRSPFFIIVETNSMRYEVLENSSVTEKGGAGHKAAKNIADKDTDVLITTQCGENAALVLNVAQIDLVKAIPGSVLENIEKYKNGDLELLKEVVSC